jgi:hypothetical protein
MIFLNRYKRLHKATKRYKKPSKMLQKAAQRRKIIAMMLIDPFDFIISVPVIVYGQKKLFRVKVKVVDFDVFSVLY